jgi:hypothetical protein
MQKRLFSLILVAALAYFGYEGLQTPALPAPASSATSSAAAEDLIFATAFENRTSQLPVQGRGTVATVLPDDNDGSRHQRFVVHLASGQSLLIAHNIDLAPRVDNIKAGDPVSFRGDYEWNPRGGVVHWTHLDPNGKHRPGWIKHGGQTFQ